MKENKKKHEIYGKANDESEGIHKGAKKKQQMTQIQYDKRNAHKNENAGRERMRGWEESARLSRNCLNALRAISIRSHFNCPGVHCRLEGGKGRGSG